MPSALHLVSAMPRFRGVLTRAPQRPAHVPRQSPSAAPHLRLVRAVEQVGMYPAVAANWVKFNQPLEGVLPFLYLDILGYVTTGMGNLVDPIGAARALPWKNADGSAADAGTITAAWNTVDALRSDPKGQTQTSGPATQYGQAFGGYTSIRLDSAGIQQAVQTTLTADETQLRTYFPQWDSMPADAQVGILSMAWAMGSGFPATFPQFTAAINAGQYATAAGLSDFRGSGVATRIAQDKKLFQNAQAVVDGGYDPSVLYWPGAPSGSPSGTGWSTVAKILGVVAGAGVVLGGAYAVSEYPGLLPDLKRAL